MPEDLKYVFIGMGVAAIIVLVVGCGLYLANVIGTINRKGNRSIQTETSSDSFATVSDGAGPAVATASMWTSRNAPNKRAVSDAVATRKMGTEIPLPPFSMKKHAFEDVYRNDLASKPDEYMVYH